MEGGLRVTGAAVSPRKPEHPMRASIVACMEKLSVEKARTRIRFLRLAFSGALFSIALAGILARGLGYPDHMGADFAGAGVGFFAVVLVKLAHLA